MSFYRSNDPAVVAAAAKFYADREAVQEEARAFAKQWGGVALFSRDLHSIRFGGLRFSEPANLDNWTTPDKKSRAQAPRAQLRIKGASKEQKEAQIALHRRYYDEMPKLRAECEPVYEAMGTNWGDLLFTGIAWFVGTDGHVYAQTSTKLGPVMVEILGSQYELAREAVQAAEKAKDGAA